MNFQVEVSLVSGNTLIESSLDKVIDSYFEKDNMDDLEDYLDSFEGIDRIIEVDIDCLSMIQKKYGFSSNPNGLPFPEETIINNVCKSDYDDTTILVSVESFDREVTFHVQTVDGIYNSSQGCWITTENSDGDIDQDDFPGFDFDKIIEFAEIFLKQSYIVYNGFVICKEDTIKVLDENPNYLNRDASPYTKKYHLIKDGFESIEEAKAFIDNEKTGCKPHNGG